MQIGPVTSTISRKLLALCAALWLSLAGFFVSAIPGVGIIPGVLAAAPVTVGGTALVTNTDGDPIRVRKAAGFEFTPVTVAWEGESVKVLDGPRSDKQGNRWFKVQAPGGTGWMLSEYLKGTGDAPAASASRSGGVARVANTDGDMLRVRSAPNTGGKIIARLNPGATVDILSGPVTDKAGITWHEISAESVTGWAMSQYLALAPGAPTSSPTVSASRKNEAVPQAKEAAESKPDSTKKQAEETSRPTPTAASTSSNATSTKAQYRQWMEEARVMHPYSQSLDKMWSVMMCESGGNPNASGGGGAWLGLFQYAPATWRGSWNPYRNSSIWDAKSQIFATAKAWSTGKHGWWTCYYK